ncbi:hypothetical protein H8699_09535 [Christensenellaceae bacterium NSJ-44]|uniref:Uncharacterized protein n=1 Tax=Luoshenia tenuis TaxID=2763654 RepID=A0A926HMZ8_9FIRM|nr:hypothetical protein [Luoshenia tenuis]MBC8529668.1 hypothetical protein [Luoshenia tenuis]
MRLQQGFAGGGQGNGANWARGWTVRGPGFTGADGVNLSACLVGVVQAWPGGYKEIPRRRSE